MGTDLEKILAKIIEGLDKTEKNIARTEKNIAKTDEQIARTDELIAKTNEQMSRTDKQLAKTDKQIKELSDMYGGVSEHLGDEAELDFFGALQDNPILANVRFDDVDFDLTRKKGKDKVQLDLFLTNGDNVAIVEVKRHLQSKHVDRLHNHTIPLFRRLFPEYKDKNLYAALATYAIPKKARKHVDKRIEQFGYGLLTPDRDGTQLVVDDHAMRVIPAQTDYA